MGTATVCVVVDSSHSLLASIKDPADLQRLDHVELDQLCQEIRSFIVEAVAKTGGHLGSNLGIVELTIALHRSLESPHDVILWDTGHQAYVHKLLTGRQKGFEELRQAGGISGYPSRSESEHDWIENSHASTALAYAHGLATAFKAAGVNRRVVAVIGDGSLTGGMAYEGLNNLGHSRADVTVILNDNGRSYAPTVSLLSDSLVKIRSNPIYMARQHRFESFTEALPLVGPAAHGAVRAWKAAVREAFEPKAFFEQLGVRYMGPFDGHDIAQLEQAITNAAEFAGPVVLHVLTAKGRGYGPAEADEIKNMHDTSELKPGSYTDAFSKAMVELGEAHPDVVAITAAMPDSTGLLPFGERFPDRLYDVGIAEQHAVTFAAGLAMGGLRPVVAVYSTFLTRAIDQTNLDVGLHAQPVIFCLDRAGITGDDGPSHHGVLDLVLMSKVPNMTILCPSSYQELRQMLLDAYTLDAGPVCIRWPKTSAVQRQPDEVGRGLSARKGRHGDGSVCFIGVGKMFNVALAAADRLAGDGIEATVWDPRAARPLDPVMLEDAAGHRLVVTAEDGYREGGIGSTVADEIGSRTRVEVLGVPTTYLPHAKPDAILASLGLDETGLAGTVVDLLGGA